VKITAFIGLAINQQLKSSIDRSVVAPMAVVPIDNDKTLHIPVNRFDFDTKTDFVAEVINQATRIYDALAKTHGKT